MLARAIYGKVSLPLPPLPEQQAIAKALGDADALIGALEALIAKKRDIKQGAMQELLTGQRRLPGFQGEWEVKPFRSVVEIPSGQVDPRLEPYRSLPLIAPDHVESNTGRLLEIKTAAEQGAISGKYEVRPGDVVYARYGRI